MSVLRTNWRINGVPIMGPDRVEYTPAQTSAIRLDTFPSYFGTGSFSLVFSLIPVEELSHILQLLEASPRSVELSWYTETGTWETRRMSWERPVIGARAQMLAMNVSITFRSYVAYGSHTALTSGKNPDTSRFTGSENPPPTARIKHKASIWGDPEVVVELDGSGSSDKDSGVVSSYQWSDNASDFSGLPGYPFDPPHTSSDVKTTFIYEYSPDMPNPRISLTVADNAGQTDTTHVEVSIPALVGSSAVFGKSFVVAAKSKVYYSTDGGLNMMSYVGFSGDATAVAGGGGFFVFGTSEGRLYRVDINDPVPYVSVFQFAGAFPKSVRSLHSTAENPSHVLAVCANGEVALSIDGGNYFSLIESFDEQFLCGVFFESDSRRMLLGTERGSGPKTLIYSGESYGTVWEVQANGLPDETDYGVGAVSASSRMQYAGLTGYSGTGGEFPVFGRTGTHWLPFENFPEDHAYPIDVVGIDMPDDGGAYILSAQGWAYKLRELLVEKSLLLGEGQVRGRCLALDPVQTGIVLFGTDHGLYKSLDDLATQGMLALPGEDVWAVDFIKEPKPPFAEILAPTWGGATGYDGVWYYQRDAGTGVPGWTIRKGLESKLPDGIYWHHITTDPNDPFTWVVVGNTSASEVFDIGVLNGSPVLVMTQTGSSPVSPVWVTKDAGLSWKPFWIRFPETISAGYKYLEWSLIDPPFIVAEDFSGGDIEFIDYAVNSTDLVVCGRLHYVTWVGVFTASCIWRCNPVPNGVTDPATLVGLWSGGVDNGGGWQNPVDACTGASGDVLMKNEYGRGGAGGHTSSRGYWGFASSAPVDMMTIMPGSPNDTDNYITFIRHGVDPKKFFALRGTDPYTLLGSTDYTSFFPVNRIIFPDIGPKILSGISLVSGVFLYMSDATIISCLDPFTVPEYETVYDVGQLYTTSSGHVTFSGMSPMRSDNQQRSTCVFLIQKGPDHNTFLNHFHRYDADGWTIIPPPDTISRFSVCTTIVS